MPPHETPPCESQPAGAGRSSDRIGDSLADELQRYEPSDERERMMRSKFVAFLRRTAAPFTRATLEGHVTGSAWIVDRAGTAVVLLRHRKLGRWLQPGGHADGERDVRAVALREAREETGLLSLVAAGPAVYDLDVHAIPSRPGEPAHEHFDVRFAFYADRSEEPSGNDESHAVRWIALDELERYGIDDSVRRLASKTGSLAIVSG